MDVHLFLLSRSLVFVAGEKEDTLYLVLRFRWGGRGSGLGLGVLSLVHARSGGKQGGNEAKMANHMVSEPQRCAERRERLCLAQTPHDWRHWPLRRPWARQGWRDQSWQRRRP